MELNNVLDALLMSDDAAFSLFHQGSILPVPGACIAKLLERDSLRKRLARSDRGWITSLEEAKFREAARQAGYRVQLRWRSSARMVKYIQGFVRLKV